MWRYFFANYLCSIYYETVINNGKQTYMLRLAYWPGNSAMVLSIYSEKKVLIIDKRKRRNCFRKVKSLKVHCVVFHKYLHSYYYIV